jgi:Docking domain of Afi1 for Arf3 in vesicle trafficking
MEHQYPAAISGDESMLAELMLPDQTHVRSQDWTIFFLHKDTESDEEDEDEEDAEKGTSKKRKKRRKNQLKMDFEGVDEADDEEEFEDEDESSDDEEDAGEGPPLMYVLNLVNTKQDNTVRRCVIPHLQGFCGS